MIKASNEFVSFVKKGVNFVNYADITLTSGEVLNLGPSDFYTDGFDLIDKTSNSDFGFGHALGKEVTIKISNRNDKFSMHDFFGAVIFVYVAVIKPDGTVLKERKGKYYVLEPATPGEVISFSAVDSMSRFDRDYNSNTVYPANLKTIMVDCCLDCGVNMGFDDFPNSDYVVKSKPTDCTYRQVVAWVSQIAGMNLRVNHNDLLEFVWYDFENMSLDILDGGNYLYTDNDVIDGGDFETYEGYVWDGGNFTDNTPRNVLKINSLTVGTDDVKITGIKIEKGEDKWKSGTDEYVLSINDNELLQDKEQEILDYLSEKMVGLTFRPLTCDIANNPLWEPLDACYVYDRKGNGYFTLINSVRYKINGFTTLSCNAKDPVRNGNTYVSESAKALVQAKRNTEKQISTYDKAVQNMNLLAANSMGLYRESEVLEDNSVIYYMSNRPIVKNEDGSCEFELDSVVYKMTGDGFFVSEDGGLSYTSGFDAQGNAIVNVLSAIGITFDWAKGGTLTLGGDNNSEGRLIVLNKDGDVLGDWDGNGFLVKSSNYKKPEISYATFARPQCGSSSQKVIITVVGIPGAEDMSVEKSGSYVSGKTEINFDWVIEKPEPDGYTEDGCPYWTLEGKNILGQIYMQKYDYETGETTGYLKRIICTRKTTKRTIVLFDTDYSNSQPTDGYSLDLKNNKFESSIWRFEDNELYKNQKKKGQMVLLQSSTSTSSTALSAVDDLLQYSQLFLVSEQVSNGNIASSTIIPINFFAEVQEGGWHLTNNTNYAAVKPYIVNDELDMEHVYLRTSSTSYTAKLYGIV